jgi:hypothetical protein
MQQPRVDAGARPGSAALLPWTEAVALSRSLSEFLRRALAAQLAYEQGVALQAAYERGVEAGREQERRRRERS